MGKNTSFGWRANGGADGFEQDHGRFTMEVFFEEASKMWTWLVWSAGPIVSGQPSHTIVARGKKALLTDAKAIVLENAARMEKEAIKEDQKFR